MRYRSSRRRFRKNDTEETRGKADEPPSPEAGPAATERRNQRDADHTAESDRTAARWTAVRRPGASDPERGDPRRGHVAYEPGPDSGSLGQRYGLEVEARNAGRLQRLEAEFGSERVSRWAEEGIPAEAMGKPRDMRAFHARQSDDRGPAGVDAEHRRGTTVQPKLEVSSPDDPAEREAEEVAETVMEVDASGTETVAPGAEPHAEDGTRDTPTVELGRTPTAGRSGGEAVPERTESTVRRAIEGTGKPLPTETRESFETQFGADFSDVRVHTEAAADEAARSIDAKAFTHGNDIAFRSGTYDPESHRGKRLLAHELTHVVQQRAAPSAPRAQRQAGAGGGASTGQAPTPGGSGSASGGSVPAEPEVAKAGEPTTEADQPSTGNGGRSWVDTVKAMGRAWYSSSIEAMESLVTEIKQEFVDVIGSAREKAEGGDTWSDRSWVDVAKAVGQAWYSSSIEASEALVTEMKREFVEVVGSAREKAEGGDTWSDRSWVDVAKAMGRAWYSSSIEALESQVTEMKQEFVDVIGSAREKAQEREPDQESSSGGSQEDTYIVQEGDTLWDIAEEMYGDGGKWRKIYRANEELIGDNPDHIEPEWELVIP